MSIASLFVIGAAVVPTADDCGGRAAAAGLIDIDREGIGPAGGVVDAPVGWPPGLGWIG